MNLRNTVHSSAKIAVPPLSPATNWRMWSTLLQDRQPLAAFYVFFWSFIPLEEP